MIWAQPTIMTLMKALWNHSNERSGGSMTPTTKEERWNSRFWTILKAQSASTLLSECREPISRGEPPEQVDLDARLSTFPGTFYVTPNSADKLSTLRACSPWPHFSKSASDQAGDQVLWRRSAVCHTSISKSATVARQEIALV